MKGFQFLGVGGNRSARRKPTKAGVESENQTHKQPLASCIDEGMCSSTKPTRLATGVVWHPDKEQNIGPTKSPGPAGAWPEDLLHRKRELYRVPHYSIVISNHNKACANRKLTCLTYL